MANVLLYLGAYALLTLAVSAFGMFLVYAGWNWGLAHAFSFTQELNLGQCFWFCVGIIVVAGLAQTKLSSKEQ